MKKISHRRCASHHPVAHSFYEIAGLKGTKTHTHMYIYIYIYIDVYVELQYVYIYTYSYFKSLKGPLFLGRVNSLVPMSGLHH